MDKRLKSLAFKVRVDELLTFQRELKEEKDLLSRILFKIDNQLHTLQVEQLHLLGEMNKSLKREEKKLESNKRNDLNQQQTPTTKALNLSVLSMLDCVEEDEEL